MPEPWHKPFRKAFRIGLYLAAHAIAALSIIAVIEVIQSVIRKLGDPKILDFIPLRYIFDIIDLAFLAVFMVFGTLEAIRVFRENADE